MKTFVINRPNMICEVTVNEDPVIYRPNDLANWDKILRITCIKIDGTEIPKRPDGNIWHAAFKKVKKDGNMILCIEVKYDAKKFIEKLKKLPKKDCPVWIICGDELEKYYSDIFLPAADKKLQDIEKEIEDKLNDAFNALTEESIISLHYNSSYGFSVSGEYSKHSFFVKALKDMEEMKFKIPEKFQTDINWGDYTTDYSYKLTFADFTILAREVDQIVQEHEEKEKIEQDKKAKMEEEREGYRKSLDCTVIKSWKQSGSDGTDLVAEVKITDPLTKETLNFMCRNIFDFGYVVNPNYEVVPGMEGGLYKNGEWQDYSSADGWVNVRPATDFEKKCIEYLSEFPPISKSIRM